MTLRSALTAAPPNASRNRRKRRNGVAALEMAIVTPFVFVIAFSAIEFTRMVMIQQALTNAAREGSRVASLATTQSTSKVEEEVRFFLRKCMSVSESESAITITTLPESFDTIQAGDVVSTSVSVDFSKISWLPQEWLTVTALQGTSTMRRE